VQKPLVNQPDQADNRGALNEASDADAETSNAALTTPREEGADMADGDSTPGKAPAFQFYPNDFIADANVVVMSMQERGVYITLLCYCWQQGSLPSAPERLAPLCGLPLATFRKLWPAVSVCFRAQSNTDRLTHPRLERERKKHRAFRKLQSDKGKLGGRPKKPGLSDQKAGALSSSGLEKSSSNFDLRSSSSDFNRTTLASETIPAVDAVRRLVDAHASFHQRFRGVAYIGNPQRDYFAACELVKAFPEQSMQDAILTFGLNDTDPFMEKGSRTIGKIASQASKYAEELKAKKLA
jgi:uncharacterized protein YdaU (DUF1376 family)